MSSGRTRTARPQPARPGGTGEPENRRNDFPGAERKAEPRGAAAPRRTGTPGRRSRPKPACRRGPSRARGRTARRREPRPAPGAGLRRGTQGRAECPDRYAVGNFAVRHFVVREHGGMPSWGGGRAGIIPTGRTPTGNPGESDGANFGLAMTGDSPEWWRRSGFRRGSR